MNDTKEFLSKKSIQLTPYVAGLQPQEGGWVKLNTNESPYPPSPNVIETLGRADITKLRLYPDGDSRALREAIASDLGVGAENIFCGNGSDEVLALAFQAFYCGKEKVLTPELSYGFYPVWGSMYDVGLEFIPLEADFSINPSAYKDANGVVIANPNATQEEIDAANEALRQAKAALVPVVVTSPSPTPSPIPPSPSPSPIPPSPSPSPIPPSPSPSPIPPSPSPAPRIITVIFNPGAGHLPHGVIGTRQGTVGFRVDNFPTPVPPAGYSFVGWFYRGQQMIHSFAATHDMTLFAHYQRIQVGRNYTITFVLNGGQMPNQALTQTHPYGTVITTLPTPTRAGHVFMGWAHGTTIQPMPFTLRGHMTLTAQWSTQATPTPTPVPTIPPSHLVVAFDPSPGVFPAGERGIRTGVYGFVVTTMPNPTRTGYTFAGWQIGNTPITLPLTVRQDTTVTARWTPIGGRVNPQTSPIQVTFTIFGAVMLVGIAAFGIMKITGKQLSALGQYRTNMTRYNREKRITDMFEKRDPKDKK